MRTVPLAILDAGSRTVQSYQPWPPGSIRTGPAKQVVVGGETIDSGFVFAAIDSLVAKSMVTAFPVGAMMRYRLLDTARAYAFDMIVDRAERSALAARHAAYCLRWLEPFAADGQPVSDAHERAPVLVGLNNVRAALEWCFGADGDPRLGVRLAAAATSAFLALSLNTECHLWSRRAIRALDEADRGGMAAMRLQAGRAAPASRSRRRWDSPRSSFRASTTGRSRVVTWRGFIGCSAIRRGPRKAFARTSPTRRAPIDPSRWHSP